MWPTRRPAEIVGPRLAHPWGPFSFRRGAIRFAIALYLPHAALSTCRDLAGGGGEEGGAGEAVGGGGFVYRRQQAGIKRQVGPGRAAGLDDQRNNDQRRAGGDRPGDFRVGARRLDGAWRRRDG